MSKQPEEQLADDLQKAIRELEDTSPGAFSVSNAVAAHHIAATLTLSQRVGQVAEAVNRTARAIERIERIEREREQ